MRAAAVVGLAFAGASLMFLESQTQGSPGALWGIGFAFLLGSGAIAFRR